MRKSSVLAIVAVLVFGLSGCVESKPSVAVVDAARLFQESDSGKAGLAHLQAMEKAMQDQLLSAQAMLEKSPSDEALRVHFQKEFAGYQELVQNEQQKVVAAINAQITEVLGKVRKDAKYAVIMPSEGIMSFDPSIDVTEAALKSMNTAPVKFEPMVLKPLTPAPAAAPEAPKADAPANEAPKTEAPATEAPAKEAPAKEAPAAPEAKPAS